MRRLVNLYGLKRLKVTRAKGILPQTGGSGGAFTALPDFIPATRANPELRPVSA